MTPLALSLVLALVQAPAQAGPVAPVLAFPEPGVDDPAAYRGYQTRFYRDSHRNTVQIYLEPRAARTTLVWADAADESAGFTTRDAAGRPAAVAWDGSDAVVSDSGRFRAIEYGLSARASTIRLGWVVLGSMRVERDVVYAKRHLQPFSAPGFVVQEESLLVAAVKRLPVAEQQAHLALLRARTLDELESRLRPAITAAQSDSGWTVRLVRPALDASTTTVLELRGSARTSEARAGDRTVTIRSRTGRPVRFRVRVLTDAAPLTPLSREEIFNPEFLQFLERSRDSAGAAGALGARRLEREVLGVELLSSREKLMAGLPNFATYFGRDGMMTALMMRPVWTPAMAEHVIGSVLGKLGPNGDVSHEEALGGQAIRENAVVYDSLVRAAMADSGDSGYARARAVLRVLHDTRENYHMVDDEFQLPVLAARYLADSAVPAERKRSFLLEAEPGRPARLALLLRELALVAGWTRPYATAPKPENLVSFPRRDSTHWRSASWRDSDAGYAGGRFAMDINAIWAPEALEAIGTIVGTLPRLGLGSAELDTASLRHAVETWRGARRHFEVVLPPAEVERRVKARLAALPADEAAYWNRVRGGPAKDTLRFLALALDSVGRPIPVVNTDPATGLFLDPGDYGAPEDLAPVVRPYPEGLFVAGLGPLVANDAFASPEVWRRFEQDRYHSPRVVWGREVNLLLLGLAGRIARDPSAAAPFRDALRRIRSAVDSSGLRHNELWSYDIERGRLRPVRYGTSSDVQLWNSTDLAVQFALSRLEAAP
ncbi:MAG TPA: hypothetical protein VJQ44_10680 [Gemmatimonadales bacterium]|nr:hypothetical protein [Gemmatimonadales bacterium]